MQRSSPGQPRNSQAHRPPQGGTPLPPVALPLAGRSEGRHGVAAPPGGQPSRERRRRVACALLPGLLAGTLQAAPPSLEINGVPAPLNLHVVEAEGARFVSASALLMLGWRLDWQNEERSSLEATDGAIRVALKADSANAAVVLKGVDSPILKPFAPAARFTNGELLLPLSVFERVLVVPADLDEQSGMLRLGTAPEPPPEDVRRWSHALGVSDPGVFQRGSGLRVSVSLPQGARLEAGREFLLGVVTNGNAHVQVYEQSGSRPPTALFGRDGSGKLLLYPAANGRVAHARRMASWRAKRWLLTTPPVGRVTYYAVATTVDGPSEDLLTMLREGGAPGDWAIGAVEVEVVR